MICQSCEEFSFFNNLEHFFVGSHLYEPVDYFADFATENDIHNLECDNCGAKLLIGDLFFHDEDDFDNAKEAVFSALADVVMQNIAACEQCSHGELMDNIHHSIESTFDDEDDDPEGMLNEFDSRTELKDLIWEVTAFDEDYYQNIVKYIECPYCKNGSGADYDEKIDYGKFDLYTDVFTKEDIMHFENKFYGDPYEEITSEITKIADICSYDELVKLKEEFVDNHLIIAQNPVFGKIFSLVKGLYENNVSLMMHKSKRLYKARTNEIMNTLIQPEMMWEPPVGKARQNRYNVSGMPVLYCANSKEILHSEVPDKNKTGYTFATLRVLNPIRLFKIAPTFGNGFEGFIEEPVLDDCEKNEFKVQYIITNILASIAKGVGYEGIVYLSVHDKRYINYSIFNYKRNTDIEIIEISDK